MARLPRLSIAGELHYILQRGHNRQPVFKDEADRQSYLQVLRDAASAQKLKLHGYALLESEVHLLATPETADGVSTVMQAVGRRYVSAFNRRHGRQGTLWEGRFRAAVIESERYFFPALTWLEGGPVRAGLCAEAAAWPWSSAAHHLGLRRDPLITDHPLYWRLGNTPFDREHAYRRILDTGANAAEASALADASANCWVLGSAGFIARMELQTARPLNRRPRGRPRKQSVPKNIAAGAAADIN